VDGQAGELGEEGQKSAQAIGAELEIPGVSARNLAGQSHFVPRLLLIAQDHVY
jgi:hypothetical protein